MVFTREWVETFFHESAYVMHTLNSIKLSQELLKNSKCTWFMTSIGDVRNLGGDILMPEMFGEKMPGTGSNDIAFVINERYPEFNVYVEDIWDNNINNWLEPLHLYANKHPEQKWEFLDDNNKPWPETHPSVTQYRMWIEDQLSERLSISNEVLQNIDKIVTIIEEMKTESKHKVLDFAKKNGIDKEEIDDELTKLGYERLLENEQDDSWDEDEDDDDEGHKRSFDAILRYL